MPKIYRTPKEWYKCLYSGIHAVQHPYQIQRTKRSGTPRLTIYYIPSFTDATGWTIYQEPGNKGFSLQSVIWRQEYDGQRMGNLMMGQSDYESPEPTLEEHLVNIESSWVENKISQLKHITIPLDVSKPFGHDGESFGVHVPGEINVEWWCEGPEEWAELIKWTYICIAYFNALNGQHR